MKLRGYQIPYVIFHFFAVNVLIWLSQQGILFSGILPVDYHLLYVCSVAFVTIVLDCLFSYLLIQSEKPFPAGWKKALFIADITATALSVNTFIGILAYIVVADASMMTEDFNCLWAVFAAVIIAAFGIYRFTYFKKHI